MTSLCLTPAEVRAALTGAEFEVRRKVKPQPTLSEGKTALWYDAKAYLWRNDDQYARDCSPFTPGTVLCGKETWCPARPGSYEPMEKSLFDWSKYYVCPVYRSEYPYSSSDYDGHWRSAATMPKWASRLSLEVLTVRCENQDGVWWWVAKVRRK